MPQHAFSEIADAQKQQALDTVAQLKAENAERKAATLTPDTEASVQGLRELTLQRQQAGIGDTAQGLIDEIAPAPLIGAANPLALSDPNQVARDQIDPNPVIRRPGDAPEDILTTDLFDSRTPLDFASAVGAGVVNTGGTIVNSFVGAPAEFVATFGSGRTKEILTKERNNIPLTESDQAYKLTYDFLLQAQTIETVEGGLSAAESAFQQGADFVKTDRAAQSQEQLQDALGATFDQEGFTVSFVGDLVNNPLGSLNYLAESLPFMYAAASQATRVPFAVAFTSENYRAGLQIYEETFKDVPDTGEKALILLGSAFIAAINSAAARFVTGEALAQNLSTKLMKTSVAEYLKSTAVKLGTKLTPAESNKLAAMLLKTGRTVATPIVNIGTKASVEFVEEGIEPLVAAATARQTIDFTTGERKEAFIGGSIGFAAGGGTNAPITLLRTGTEKLVDRQERVLRQREEEKAAAGNLTTAVLGTLGREAPEYRTENDGSLLDTEGDYDPLRKAQEGPADENSISDLHETIGHIRNANRVNQTFTEEELTQQGVQDYAAAVHEQVAVIAAYQEQIQNIAQGNIRSIKDGPLEQVPGKTADVLKGVFFGSDEPPINLDHINALLEQFEESKSEFTAEQLTEIRKTLGLADDVKTAEEAVLATSVPTSKKGRTAADVHEEIINGTLKKDGSRDNKGGTTYRSRLSGFINTGNTVAFEKEMDQLNNFIENQKSKLPDNHPNRAGSNEVWSDKDGKDIRFRIKGQLPAIIEEVAYLEAIKAEANASQTKALSSVAAPGVAPADPGAVPASPETSEDPSAEESGASARDLSGEVTDEGTTTVPQSGVSVASEESREPDERAEDTITEGITESESEITLPPVPDEPVTPRGTSEAGAVPASEAGTEGAARVPEPSQETIPEVSSVETESAADAAEEERTEVGRAEPGAAKAATKNPNLEGLSVEKGTIKPASSNKGRDIRSIAIQFKNSAKNLADQILLRTGALGSGFDTFLATLKEMNPNLNTRINSDDWTAIRDIYTRYEVYKEIFDTTQSAELGPNRTATTIFGANYADNLVLGLASVNEDGVPELRPEVIAAMAVASALWVTEDSYRTLNVDARVLEKWFGVDEREIDPRVINEFRDKGISRSLVANDIGKRVYESLGITTKGEAAVGAKEKLINALGQLTIGVMSENKEIELNSRSQKDINDLFWGTDRARQPKQAAANTQSTKIQVVTVRVRSIVDPETGFDQVHTGFFKEGRDPTGRNVPGVFKRNPDLSQALFNMPREHKGPLEESKTEVNTNVRGGPTELTDEQQKEMAAAQKIEHRTAMNTAGLLVELGRPFMRKLLGYIDNVDDVSHVDNLGSNTGKNLEIEENITHLLEHVSAKEDGGNGFNADDKPFFFGMFATSNRRSYYDTNQFNPQDTKLHRHSIKLNNKPAEIPTDVGSESFIPFLLAITTGLGISDDKVLLADHITRFNAFAKKNGAAINKAIKDKDGDAILALLPDQSAHAFQALVEFNVWFEAQSDGAESFVSDMTMETDGVTNGAAIGFMQLAHSFTPANMWSWLERMGIYRKSSGIKGFQDWKSKGNDDSYEHMARKVVANLAAQLDSLDEAGTALHTATMKYIGPLEDVDGGVTPAARELLKYPFMIHNYGASTSRILDAIANQIIENIQTQIEEAHAAKDDKKLAEIATDINTLHGRNNTTVTLTLDDALETSLNTVRRFMSNNVVAILKDPVTDALNNELGNFVGIRSLINDAFQIQFDAFDIAYKIALKEISKDNPEGVDLTENQARLALKEVEHLLPGFQGAMVNTTPENRIPVLSTKNVLGNQDMDNVIQIYLNQANKVKAKSVKGRSVREIFVDGGIKGAIFAIHSLDATVQQRTMQIMREQHGIDIVNIFDAGLTDVNSAALYTETYNQVFIETMRDYSLLKDIRAMMSAIENSPELNKAIKTRFEERSESYTGIDGFLVDLDAQIIQNETRKATIFGQDLVVEQMVNPDEESQYQYKGQTEAEIAESAIVFQDRNPEKSDVTQTTDTAEGRTDTDTETDTEGGTGAVQPEGESFPLEDTDAPIENLEAYLLKRLNAFPKIIQDMVGSIIVLTDPNDPAGRFRADGLDENGKPITSIAIHEALNKGPINPLNSIWFRGLNRRQLINQVFYHELGHAIDFEALNLFGERVSAPFNNADIIQKFLEEYAEAALGNNRDTKPFTNQMFSLVFEHYGSASQEVQSKEILAQVFSWYITNRKTLLAEQPEMHAYMEATYAAILDKQTDQVSAPTSDEGLSEPGQTSESVTEEAETEIAEPIAEGVAVPTKTADPKKPIDADGDPIILREKVDPNLAENSKNGYKLFEDNPELRTNSEQDKAIDAIRDFANDTDPDNKIFTLLGRGGTGKTTIIGKAIELLDRDQVTFYAPSNKAAGVLSRASDTVTYTVTQGLGARAVNTGKTQTFETLPALINKALRLAAKSATGTQPGKPMVGKNIIVIDEASMLSEEQLEKIFTMVKENDAENNLNTKIILMGDNAQLPPIGEERSKAFDFIAGSLTFRMRQGADSPIPELTDKIADNTLVDEPVHVVLGKEDRVTDLNKEDNSGIVFTRDTPTMWDNWKSDYLQNPTFTKLLTYNNNTQRAIVQSVFKLNQQARKILYGNNPDYLETNESIVLTGPAKGINEIGEDVLLPTSTELIVTEIIGNENVHGNVGYTEVDASSVDELVTINKTFKLQGEVEVIRVVVTDDAGSTFNMLIPTPAGQKQVQREIDAAAKDKRFSDMHAIISHFASMQYGYAVNAHIAQGSTYRNVYVFEDNILNRNDNFREQNQSLYVAMSRPSHKLVMVSELNLRGDDQAGVHFSEQTMKHQSAKHVGTGIVHKDFEGTDMTTAEIADEILAAQERQADATLEADSVRRRTENRGFHMEFGNPKFAHIQYRIDKFLDGVFTRRNRAGVEFPIDTQDVADDTYSQEIMTEMLRISNAFIEARNDEARLNEILEGQSDSLQEQNDLQSSDRQIDIDNFVEEQQQTLTSENVETIFNSISGLVSSPISKEFKAHLRKVLNEIIKKGIKPLDKLILRTKSDQSGTFGAISGHNIYMNNSSVRETYSEQSAEEVLVHELIHAISANFIEKNPAGRNKIRRLYEIARDNITWEDFLKRDTDGNIIFTISEAAEIAQAKRTYNYVFNTRESLGAKRNPTNNALHEFFAHALTNEQLVKKLESIPTRETKFTKEGNLLTSLLSYLEDIFNFVAETLNNTSGKNAQEEINNIAHSIIAAEQNGVFTVLNAIETGFATARKPLDLSVEYLVKQLVKMIKIVAPKQDAAKLLSFIPNTLRSVANTVEYHQAIESQPGDSPVSAVVKDTTNALLSAMTAEDGVMRKTMNSLINRSSEFRKWHKLLRNSKHMIDQLRRTISATISRNVKENFTKVLDEIENKAITQVFLAADLDSLENYSLQELTDLMNDPVALKREVKTKRADLMRSLTPSQRSYIDAQSDGLASMMIRGDTNTFNQSLNAHQILHPLGKRDMVPQLDEYISLLALQEVPLSGRQLAATIIEREEAASPGENGITYVQAQHKAFKEESLVRLFNGNPMMMTKGYMAEIYDQAKDVRIAPLADKVWLEKEGYVLQEELFDDFTAPTKEAKGLYVATNNPRIQRLKSIVSVADKAVKGTTLSDSSRAAGQGYSRTLDALQIAKTKHLYSARATGTHTTTQKKLVPVRNENGEIVNYRYQMSEQMRSDLLAKDYDIANILGAMHASIDSKANSEAINNEAVRVAHADWVANGEQTPERFIPISNDPKSPHFETYKLMPKAMRRDVENLFGKGQPMMIRGELVDIIFGFRKASLANLPLVKEVPQFAHVVRLIENGWQEIIAQEKVNIVIKTLDVMLNNIISNTILLKVMGIPMSDILRDTKEAVDGMNRYQKDFEELIALQKELAGDPKKAKNVRFTSRVEFLRNELRVNPVSELVDEGIFQSITEDIDADQYGDKTKLIDWLQNTVGKHTPAFVKKGVEYAYISENTQAFKFLMKTTQYSDFTARYVMWKHEMAKPGADKDQVLDEIIRTFINYDDPSNKYTQWGNDVGLIMFTKFAIGIQNVIIRIAGKKTANFVTSLLMQQYLVEAADITDSFFLTGGVSHMFHLNPVEHIENAIAPYGLVTAADYLF